MDIRSYSWLLARIDINLKLLGLLVLVFGKMSFILCSFLELVDNKMFTELLQVLICIDLVSNLALKVLFLPLCRIICLIIHL